MSRSSITVQKLNGGLGRTTPSTDGVCALLMNGIATTSLTLGEVYELNSFEDVTALGIDENYDDVHEVLVYHHISRVFLRNPSAVIYIMLVDQEITLTEMVDKDNLYLAKLLKDKAGLVVQWAVARNPNSDYTPTLVTGLDDDVVNAVDKAQELITYEETKFRYSQGIIEGRSFNGTTTAALDLRTKTAPGVSVVIGADPSISNANTLYNGYAAVGDVLGLVSVAAVSQNIGEFSVDFNLNDVNEPAFLTAGISSNKNINEYTDASLDALHEKGYIFADSEPGQTGFYLNDSSTCVSIDSDYAYIENNRAIQKAIKLVRAALMPRIKRRVAVDPDTGYIARTEAKDIETTIKGALQPMQTDGDVSGGIDAYVNPEQNILSTSNLLTKVSFVPMAIGRQITFEIGFNNPFK